MIWAPDIALTYSYTGGGTAGTSFRNECKSISAGGSQVRVTIKGPLKCDRLFVGVATTPPATSAAPVELKINGASGCNLGSGQEVTTDWASLTVSSGQTLMVGGDHSADGGLWIANTPPWIGGAVMSNCDEWYGAPSWNVSSPSMTENAGLCVAVTKIEAQTESSPEPLPGPPAGQWFGPCVSAYMVGNQAFSAGTYQKVLFDHATYDADGCFDIENSRFICRLAGIYRVKVTLAFAGSIPAGLAQQVLLCLPSPSDPTKQYFQEVSTQSGPGSVELNTEVFLFLGDELHARGYVSGGEDLSFTGQSCEFVVSYVRPCTNCGQT